MKHLLTLVGFLVVIGFGITVFFVLGRWQGSEAINIPNAPGQQIEGIAQVESIAQDIKTQQRTLRKQNPIRKVMIRPLTIQKITTVSLLRITYFVL